jgi:hypothetical protein
MMKSVRVDPPQQTVRVEPGCTSGDVDHATHAFGLAVPSGIVASTGIAGLTLGGGTGYLTRKHGLTIDNLLEADVVLARRHDGDGQRDVESGPVLGAARRWRQLRRRDQLPVPGPPVLGRVCRTDLLGRGRRAHGHAGIPRLHRHRGPRKLGIFVGPQDRAADGSVPQPHWGKRACAIIGAFNGTAAQGARAMEPLLSQLPPPLFNWMGPMPFPAHQLALRPVLPERAAVVLEGRLRDVTA